jgi:hypothetical protein
MNKEILSVRAWNVANRYKLADGVQAGDMAMRKELRNAGLATAIEFYRAAGMGVHTIVAHVHKAFPWATINPHFVQRVCDEVDNRK